MDQSERKERGNKSFPSVVQQSWWRCSDPLSDALLPVPPMRVAGSARFLVHGDHRAPPSSAVLLLSPLLPVPGGARPLVPLAASTAAPATSGRCFVGLDVGVLLGGWR